LKLTKAVIHTLVIFVVLSLVIQPISSTNAQVSDERKKAEDTSKKIQAELDKAKSTLKITKNAWKIAKNVTDDAKDAFNQNKSDKNLDAIKQAKIAENVAYQIYQKALKDVQNFTIKLENSKSVDKATKDVKNDSASAENENRIKSKEITKKIQEDLDKEKVKLANAKQAWIDAKDAKDDAIDAFKQNPTESNLFDLNQAKQAEAKAYQNYKNVLVKVQAFKPDITPDVIEKAEKSTDDSTVDSKSDERKKAEDETIKITNKIQIQLNMAESTLKNSIQTWNSTKVTKDFARQIYYQNPTVENLETLNQAKQDEAFALFFYHKALNDVKFYKAKLVDFS